METFDYEGRLQRLAEALADRLQLRVAGKKSQAGTARREGREETASSEGGLSRRGAGRWLRWSCVVGCVCGVVAAWWLVMDGWMTQIRPGAGVGAAHVRGGAEPQAREHGPADARHHR